MIFDFHVHIGWFNENYFSPEYVFNTLKIAGITDFVFSSTSHVISDDKKFLLEEREKVLQLSDNHGILFQWLTPEMVNDNAILEYWLDNNVKGLKFHAKSYLWQPFNKYVEKIFSIARERNLPVLIHSGEEKNTRPEDYDQFCEQFNDVKVVFAHGRPLNSALSLLNKYKNVYIDTSFMPNSDIKTLVSLGLKDKILFGTDTPIPQLFYKKTLTTYLKTRIKSAKRIGLDFNIWKKIFNM